ncbi:hypothetical protein ACFL7D_10440 [candidate division KSB1 bacterium]
MKHIILILLCVLLTFGAVYGQSGTAVGMGEAYTTFARGSEAIFWNPANLAFTNEGLPGFSMSLFSLKLNAGQNALDIDLYNDYFTEEGKILSDDNINDLLGRIPDEGLKADFRTDVSLLAMSYKNFGFSVESGFFADLSMPKSLVEIPFNGLEQKTYDFSPDAKGEGLIKLNFAYGRIVARDKVVNLPMEKTLNFKEIAVGGSFAYMMGIAKIDFEKTSLFADITDNGIVARGEIIGHGTNLVRVYDPVDGTYDLETSDETGISGKGFGLNFGATGKLDNGYMVSVVVKNLIDRMSWNKDVVKFNHVINTGDPMFPNELGDLEEDDYHTDNDEEVGSFTSSLPIELRFAVGRKVGRYMYAAEIGRENEKFLFALGGGLKWAIFNLYGGYQINQSHGLNFGIGFGGQNFMWDFAVGSRGGVKWGSNKGLAFATSMRFGM